MKSKKSEKSIYCCENCGYQTPKWMGRCPDCGKWNSLIEERPTPAPIRSRHEAPAVEPVAMGRIELHDVIRVATGIGEFDRVLGGGVVPGSLVLVGGDPGIGKSTLMLQVMSLLVSSGHKALYVSGEESIQQIKLRSKRLSISDEDLLVASEINLGAISSMAEEMRPTAMVVDSVQTVSAPEVASAPGSVTQVREAAMHLMFLAKRTGSTMFLVGHVTKEGAIAGPRLLEHMVDTVLYFESSGNGSLRILRAVKNRFGSTNEIGVFEMKDSGLAEVPNPSSVFLPERTDPVPGSVVTASIEGSRPILLEIQSLVSKSGLGTSRRAVLGVDPNRVSLLVAVMEKNLGLELTGDDIFVNVAGGVKIDEPAVDLGILSAILSSFWDTPVRSGTVVSGEVGLTGEVRAVSRAEQRVGEAEKLGFKRCVLPRGNVTHMQRPGTMELIGVDSVSEAVESLF